MFNTKSIFNWNVPQIKGGDPLKFAQLLVDANFEGVYLKCADGPFIFKQWPGGPWPSWGENVKIELVNALRDAGLKVYFWHFLYGHNPKGELDIAVHQCDEFKPDGYIWNVEGSFDEQVKAEANSRMISTGFRKLHPEIPQALCWWAFPLNPRNPKIEWHPIRVAKAWMEVVDYVMPMMYWDGSGASNAVSYLEKSIGVWRSFCNLPMIPVGRAYIGDGGKATSEAIEAFAQRVMELDEEAKLVGISWWSLDHSFKNVSWWDALTGTPRFSGPPIPTLPTKVILERLVNNHKELFPELFG